jgi:RNA polymerase sigma-70 factor (ECF subfamily)
VELEDVFRAHQQAVFAYFLRLVGNRQDAEELTQETFVRACGAALRYRGDSKVSTWLFGIARRVLPEATRAGPFVRDLAEVRSPEVVREALRRFRRRVLLRSVWVGSPCS